MDAAEIETGGRVTRALRKRIASTDTDNSSRPGTPVQSKLPAGTNSPLKPRMTRRNSTSGTATPTKTPAKRGGGVAIAAIAETEAAIETPTRRVTRRRSLSTSAENEGTPQQVTVKAPIFETLIEEPNTGRVTRSQSKSPEQLKVVKTIKESAATPKRKSLRNINLAASNVEIETENSFAKKNVAENNLSNIVQKDAAISSQKILENKENVSENDAIIHIATKEPMVENIMTNVAENIVNVSINEAMINGANVNKESVMENISNETVNDAMVNVTDPNKAGMNENKLSMSSDKETVDEDKTKDGIHENKLSMSSDMKTIDEDMFVNDTLLSSDIKCVIKETDEMVLEDLTENNTSLSLNSVIVISKPSDELNVSLSSSNINADQEGINKNISLSSNNLKEENQVEKLMLNSDIKDTNDILMQEPLAVQNISMSLDSTIVIHQPADKAPVSLSISSITAEKEAILENNSKENNVCPNSSIIAEAKESHVDKTEYPVVITKVDNKSDAPQTAETELATTILDHNNHQLQSFNDKVAEVSEMDKEGDAMTNVESPSKGQVPMMDNEDFAITNVESPSKGQNKTIITKEEASTELEVSSSIDQKMSNKISDYKEDMADYVEEPHLVVSQAEESNECESVDVAINDKSCMIVESNELDTIQKESLTFTASSFTNQPSVDFIDTEKNDSANLQINETTVIESPKKIENNSNEIALSSKQPKPSPVKVQTNLSNPSTPVRIIKKLSVSNSSKSVGFNALGSDDECEKSIYPKTPGTAKSKSYIEIDTSREYDDSVMILDNSYEEIIPETQQEVIELVDETFNDIQAGDKESKDDKISVKSVEKSTNNLKLTPKKKSLPLKYDEDSADEKQEELQLKWCNPSIKAKGSKLDTITNDEQNDDEPIVKSLEKPKKKKQMFLKRTEWNSEDEDEEIGLASDDADEEEPYRRKHVFHDDEAMEVDDYESGDSMDSEERREMLENEIPVDGESIGSHTTDDERDDHHDDEEDDDSFIVSDNDEQEDDAEQLRVHSSTDSDDEADENNDFTETKKRDKKKTFKRIQRISQSSSSSDEQEEDKLRENIVEKELNEKQATNDADDNPFNSTKLSDSARRLQSEGEDESTEELADANKSRKEILRELNQSERFNKSLRDLNPDADVSPEVGQADKLNDDEDDDDVAENSCNKSLLVLRVSSNNQSGLISPAKTNDKSAEEGSALTPFERRVKNKLTESMLGEVTVTSEEENVSQGEEIAEEEEEDEGDENEEEEQQEELEEDDMADESDDEPLEVEEEQETTEAAVDAESDEHDKENASQMKKLSKDKRGLSVSFGHVKIKKQDSLQKQVLQRSFTIGVSINGQEVGTAVFETKPTDSTASPSTSTSSNEETDAVLSTDDIRYLENVKHMPLGNRLVRTRRQSLALPTDPDMEICSSQLGIAAPTAKQSKRKSLALLSGNDFNPSQSLIDSIEFRKAEMNRQTAKRKRLSKSFCGTTEGLDASIDLNARHLHKRSKLAIDSSFVDSVENLSTNGPRSKITHSSTPHEKIKKNDNNNNNNSIQRILGRCEEILEAANRAKLESKLNYQKSKVKLSKKKRKKLEQRQSLSPDSKRDKLIAASLSKDFKKKKDKCNRSAAVTRALKASADILIGKNRHADDATELSKRLPLEVLEELAELAEESARQDKTKQTKKEPLAEKAKFRHYTTSAGNVIETLRTPEKKKKPKIIHLATGKMCVEPLTPSKRSIRTSNGMEFHESPMTPYGGGAPGFSIQFTAVDTPKFSHAADCKRKRIATDGIKKKKLPRAQWTQSGHFVEEEITADRFSQHSRILKKHVEGSQQVGRNFKQSALMRDDVKRSTLREILQLRERRHF